MACFFRQKYVALAAAFLMGISHIYAADYCAQPRAYECSDVTFCTDECCDDWWISGDLLCWSVRQESDLGTTRVAAQFADGVIFSNVERHSSDIRFKWDLGFRVGAGYHYPCDDWDAAIYWTHFRNDTHGHRCANASHWRLHFDTVDANLGYRYFFEPSFSIKPFLGVRYARINQKVSAHAQATFINAEATVIAVAEARNKSEFWGAGPQLGFEADWTLGCGWSVYAGLAGDFLYGDFHVHTLDVIEAAPFVTNVSSLHDKVNRRTVQTGIDGCLGIRWDINCMTLQLGVEHHRYFDFDQIDRGGALDLFGANASLVIHF